MVFMLLQGRFIKEVCAAIMALDGGLAEGVRAGVRACGMARGMRARRASAGARTVSKNITIPRAYCDSTHSDFRPGTMTLVGKNFRCTVYMLDG